MSRSEEAEVVVCGGGPVGLFLGCRLSQLGIRVLVVERDAEPRLHTRSIGIHPPSLKRFGELGVLEAFRHEGCAIRKGLAFANGVCMAEVDFSRLPGPHKEILTVPQYRTEALLEEHLEKTSPRTLQRGCTVEGVRQLGDRIHVDVSGPDKQHRTLTGSYVVGCEGKDSLVRSRSGIAYPLERYTDAYLLADFEGSTLPADVAHIYLCREGLVESFPLPGKVRRWVLKTRTYESDPKAARFCEEVCERTDVKLDPSALIRLNPFHIERGVATRLVKGRALLAGDAAHTMSPIGGQGMNVGWLDAWDAADALHRLLREGGTEQVLKNYETLATCRAWKAIRRASWNTRLGRASPWHALRVRLIAAGLRCAPFHDRLATVFSMSDLDGPCTGRFVSRPYASGAGV